MSQGPPLHDETGVSSPGPAVPPVPVMTNSPVTPVDSDGPAVPAAVTGPPGPPGPPAATGAWTTDLGCPQCGYNLRGLSFVSGPTIAASDSGPARPAPSSGLLVDCPECGLRSDLGELAQRRWDKPWFKAPGFNLMTAPVAFLLFSVIGSLVAFGVLVASVGGSGTTTMLVTMALSMVVLVGWIGMLSWVYVKCGGAVGVLFSLLAHVIFVGYLAGLIMIVSGAVSTFFFLTDTRRGAANSSNALEIAVSIGMVLGGVVLFIVGRICEKQVAGHCIRLYLKRATTS